MKAKYLNTFQAKTMVKFYKPKLLVTAVTVPPPPPITQQTDEVQQLAAHYNITFVDAICDEAPCLVNVIAEPAAASYSLEQLQAMAMHHFNRAMIKDKSKSNYFKAWSNDMAEFIQATGNTQQQFLNSLNIN